MREREVLATQGCNLRGPERFTCGPVAQRSSLESPVNLMVVRTWKSGTS